MITEAHRTGIADHYQATDVQVGYEDMANPLRVGTVVEHRAGEFRVMWDDEDGGETWSDLRQAGWRAIRPDYTIATTAGVVIAQVEHHDIAATYSIIYCDGRSLTINDTQAAKLLVQGLIESHPGAGEDGIRRNDWTLAGATSWQQVTDTLAT